MFLIMKHAKLLTYLDYIKVKFEKNKLNNSYLKAISDLATEIKPITPAFGPLTSIL